MCSCAGLVARRSRTPSTSRSTQTHIYLLPYNSLAGPSRQLFNLPNMASPQVPSSSRLVSKLAVHGRVSVSAAGQQPSSPAQDGVLISLFCKVNVPHAPANSSQSYPLFPGAYKDGRWGVVESCC
jgi:hypothetical protein